MALHDPAPALAHPPAHLSSSADALALLPSQPRLKRVEIVRPNIQAGFGFSVFESDDRHYISRVQMGTPADGKLRVGDHIITVNGNIVRSNPPPPPNNNQTVGSDHPRDLLTSLNPFYFSLSLSFIRFAGRL